MTVMTPRPTILNGIYTISSERSGEHRTFRARTAEKLVDPRTGQMSRVLELLDGPSNTSDYRGFAFVDDAGVRVWRRFRPLRDLPEGCPKDTAAERRRRKESRRWQAYADLVWSLLTRGGRSSYASLGYSAQSALHCCRCNALLTDPISIERGYGPTCFELGLSPRSRT